MNAPANLLDELLEDAKLVAGYCQRTGRLKDASLPTAIAEVEKLATRGWNDNAVVKLQVALNSAVQAIAPTTLIDLRAGWTPDVAQKGRLFAQLAFGSLSAILMLFAAWYTVQYNLGSSTIHELERLQADKVGVQLSQTVQKLITADPKIGELIADGILTEESETYLTLIDQLRDINDSVGDQKRAAGEFLHLSDDPFTLLNRYAAPYLNRPISSIITQAAIAASVPSPETERTLKPYNPCLPVDGDARFANLVETSFVKLIKTFRSYVANMLCAAEVTVMPFVDLDIDDLTDQARRRINVLGLWFLPAIYGALGATIYYLRRVVDPTLPDPPAQRIIYRIALGAFSGVILAWFWTPTNRLSSEIAEINLNLFGVAFLLGFSVEIFFTFLDRMVFLTINWIKKIGTAA